MKKIYIIAQILLFPCFVYAECIKDNNGTCRTWQNSGNCGTNCSYSYDDNTGILTVTGGNNASIASYFFDKKTYENNAENITINKIILDGEFSVGSLAFGNTSSKIYGKNGYLTFNSLGANSFGSNDLYGNIVISDNAVSLGEFSLLNTHIHGNIIIPENVNTLNWSAFKYWSLDGQIICGAPDCKKKIADSCKNDDCKEAVSRILDQVELFPDGCTKMNANLKCTRCKSQSFKLDDGWCFRKIYTPAEAAEVLTDDNNNSVTITFKL